MSTKNPSGILKRAAYEIVYSKGGEVVKQNSTLLSLELLMQHAQNQISAGVYGADSVSIIVRATGKVRQTYVRKNREVVATL